MKKIIILAFATFSLTVSSQTSIQASNITNTNSPIIVAAGSDILMSTHKYIDADNTFDFKNTSSTGTNTYVVKRYDIVLNKTSLPDTAIASFCFAGLCFGAATNVSPQLPLDHGQSTSEIPGVNFVLDTHLNEASAIGFSHVKYTFMNVLMHSDSLQFSIKYNQGMDVGIKEINKSISSFEIFPNPAKQAASLLINSPKAFDSNLLLFNSLGEVVYQKNLNVTEGKNKIDINIETLPSGVYFASIKTAGITISKKLIVN